MFNKILRKKLPSRELQEYIYNSLKQYFITTGENNINIGDNKTKIKFPAIVFGDITSVLIDDKTKNTFEVTIIYITGSNQNSRIETEEMLSNLYFYHCTVLKEVDELENYTLDIIRPVVISQVEKDEDIYKGMATYQYILTIK